VYTEDSLNIVMLIWAFYSLVII